ncbi:uncharacterized protein PWA37_001159 [Arxiozyma heterogenica]|uniref:uncharacterized protein n=1 Tax=Arxiozyma heterogenica TaxID=278026 RepID=UPI002F1043D1
MRTFFPIILDFRIYLNFVAAASGNTAFVPVACAVPGNGISRATVRFYDYLLGGDPTYKNTVTDITNIKWDAGPRLNNPPYGFTDIPITTFLMEITDYYRAPMTGIYTVTTNSAGFISVFMGTGLAFDCGSQDEDFGIGNFQVTNSGSVVSNMGQTSREIYPKEGYFYPFRVAYINYYVRGILDILINLPNGTVDSTIDQNVYSISDNNPNDFSSISFSFTGLTIYTTTTTTRRTTLSRLTATTTTRTKTYTSRYNRYNQKVIVEYYEADLAPKPSTITSYTRGSVHSTTTISTYTSYATDSRSRRSPVNVMVIETPIPSTTISTITSYIINSNGHRSPVDVIVVETPPPKTVTLYTKATVSSRVAVSTSTSYTTDSNDNSTPIDVVIVEIPRIVSISIRHLYWDSSVSAVAMVSSESIISDGLGRSIGSSKNMITSKKNTLSTVKIELSSRETGGNTI